MVASIPVVLEDIKVIVVKKSKFVVVSGITFVNEVAATASDVLLAMEMSVFEFT